MTTQSPDQSLTPSPAPSKDVYDQICEAAWELLRKLAGPMKCSQPVSIGGETPIEVQLAKDAMFRLYRELESQLHEARQYASDSADLAAELGKEREAEVATLRAELADRWRDMTANEQQTQRLLNDIENLRAEIAELKARP